MKMRFYYQASDGESGRDVLWRSAQLIGTSTDAGFNKYLGAMLTTDFQSPRSCESVLNEFELVERGEKKKSDWGGNAFDIEFNSQIVKVEHTLFSGHPEWPAWRCTVAQFKEALLGWKRFLTLSASTESEITVELPNA